MTGREFGKAKSEAGGKGVCRVERTGVVRQREQQNASLGSLAIKSVGWIEH